MSRLYPYDDNFKIGGFSCIFNNYTCIFYDNNLSEHRQRFTIAHEYGHLSLQHVELDCTEFEKEANMFAARILCPLFLIKECNIKSPQQIVELCNISFESASYRLTRYSKVAKKHKFYTSKYEKKLFYNIKSFINKYNKNKI